VIQKQAATTTTRREWMLKNEYGYELDYDREENVMFINISG
jgi:hypothetical protein